MGKVKKFFSAHKGKQFYQRRISAISVLLLACDKTDEAAWDKKECFAKLVVSSAISTSTIRPREALMFGFGETRDSELKVKRELDPPF